jgi:hypothetical protein
MAARLMPIVGVVGAEPVWLGGEQAFSAITLKAMVKSERPLAICVPQETLMGKQLSR